MGFKTRYTTTKLISLDTTVTHDESKKIVITDDTYITCELIELLINTMRNK